MSLYERLSLVVGKNNLNKINNKNIVLIGLGGVGGSCFESLIRSGILNITVCDYDKFEETNLNRQILCNSTNIGKLKTDVASKFAKNINSNCNVIKFNCKLDKENIETIIPSNTDYIIDACDDILAKIELIKYAIKCNIKIISSMGTANKLDPSKLEITDIWKTSYDPLAKKIRTILRKEKIDYKLKVVSSYEQSIENGTLLGSFAPVCNIAGILLASYVLNDIIKSKD